MAAKKAEGHIHPIFQTVSNFKCSDLAGEFGCKVGVDRFLNVNPVGTNASLTTASEFAENGSYGNAPIMGSESVFQQVQ